MSADAGNSFYMRSFKKNTALIFVLSLIITVMSGCSGSSASSDFKTTDYPPAPANLMNATLTKLDGSTFKLADYKGKVLVVNVWATWCGPCRHEIPELIKLQKDLKEKGFEVVGLNVDDDETPEMIKGFAGEMGVNYDLVKGDHNLFLEFYKISKKDAIPQSFLIDREGKLLGVFVGGGPTTLKKLIDSANKVTAG